MKKQHSLRIISLILPVVACAPAMAQDGAGDRNRRENRRTLREKEESDRSAPQVGELAPTFTVKSLDGKEEFNLQSFRGQKPVLLIFGSYT